MEEENPIKGINEKKEWKPMGGVKVLPDIIPGKEVNEDLRILIKKGTLTERTLMDIYHWDFYTDLLGEKGDKFTPDENGRIPPPSIIYKGRYDEETGYPLRKKK